MTTLAQDRRVTTPIWHARSELEILVDQLRGIAAWHEARRAAEAPDGRHSRDMRLDLDRNAEALRRQHRALVAHADQHLHSPVHTLSVRPAPRAVIAHRNAWFRDQVSSALCREGIEVAAQMDNGADAVGVVVVEQPDLLLVEDKLSMLAGPEVLRQALPLAPGTLAAAHVSCDEAVALLLDAGACTAFTRRVPPADVAMALCSLVRT